MEDLTLEQKIIIGIATTAEKIEYRRANLKMTSLDRQNAYTLGGVYADNESLTERDAWEQGTMIAKRNSINCNNKDFKKVKEYTNSFYAGFKAQRERLKRQEDYRKRYQK